MTRTVDVKVAPKRKGPRLQDADKVFSVYIRLRDGRCRRCGVPDRLQCAHVISRRYHATRFDEQNAYALCLGCHKWETERPLEGHDFWVSLIGDSLYHELRVKALERGHRLDLKAIIAHYRGKLAGVTV